MYNINVDRQLKKYIRKGWFIMKNYSRKVLLGATKYNTLIFANVEIRENAEGNVLSISFDEVRPFIASESYLKEVLEEYVDYLDDTSKLSLLESFDCKPSELVEEMYWNLYVEEYIDISLFPESFMVEGCNNEIYFESVACGQIDCRNELIPINPEFSKWLFNLWDKYHLKNIDTIQVDKIKAEILSYNYHYRKWINEWIEDWLEKLIEVKKLIEDGEL